jgi:hypothetical protein
VVHFPDDPPAPDASFLPTQEQADRVLAPHQTIRERNLSQHVASRMNDPLWIRTCYAPGLQAVYDQMIEAGLRDSENPERLLVLDDEELYGGFGDDWTKVFLRLPLIPDAVAYFGGDPEQDDVPLDLEQPDEETQLPLFLASLQDKQAVFLVDEQALRTNLIKVLYLDIHGQAVWHNTISPGDIEYFEAEYNKGGTLLLIQERCLNGDEYLLQPGAQLHYE